MPKDAKGHGSNPKGNAWTKLKGDVLRTVKSGTKDHYAIEKAHRTEPGYRVTAALQELRSEGKLKHRTGHKTMNVRWHPADGKKKGK
jgi:hypothetical protein